MTTSDFPQYSQEEAVKVLHGRVDKLRETAGFMPLDKPHHMKVNVLIAIENLKDYISIVLLDCMREGYVSPSQQVPEEELV